jgi:hypothetical protein|nr:MAG TPA: tail assembly chaperone protein [Caudoviricetes sp.]
MQKEIVINGKAYPTKEITFNTVCQFEDMGIPMSEIEAKSIMFVRAYAAMCMDKKADQAGDEIEKHVMNGGSIDELADVLRQAVEESGFFQALSKRAETADSESQTETT